MRTRWRLSALVLAITMAGGQATVLGDNWGAEIAKRALGRAAREGIQEALEDAVKDATLDAALGTVLPKVLDEVVPEPPPQQELSNDVPFEQELPGGHAPIGDPNLQTIGSIAGAGVEAAMVAADVASAIDTALDVAEAAKAVHRAAKVGRAIKAIKR